MRRGASWRRTRPSPEVSHAASSARFGSRCSAGVTTWTKLDMRWKGVSVDTLLEAVELDERAAFVIAWSDGGYTTNLPLADVLNGQAFVAYEYDGAPLVPEHGGPARLVVPARYFWKSAKWIRGIRLQAEDQPGFWESFGY